MLVRNLVALTMSSIIFCSSSMASDKAPKGKPKEESQRNYLKCENMDWMSDCGNINKHLRENPQAPVRAFNQNGLEFNFPPDTPVVMMEHILQPSPQTARNLADFMDQHVEVANMAAFYFEDEMNRREAIGNTGPDIYVPQGTTFPDNKPIDNKKIAYIDTKNLSLLVLAPKDCEEACNNIPKKIAELKSSLPHLSIGILNFGTDNLDIELLKDLNTQVVKANKNQIKYFNKKIANGINRKPVLAIRNKRNNSFNFVGNPSSNIILSQLAEASK